MIRKANFLLLLNLFVLVSVSAQSDTGTGKFSGYLFAYFEGKGADQEQLRFAVSEDAVNWHALNNNRPIISSSEISRSEERRVGKEC